MSDRIEESFHLSPVQHGMLFHHLSTAHSGVDIEQIVVDFPEAIDADALRTAWNVEVWRQPVLRTAFRWSDADAPVQEIHAGAVPEFTVHDWSGEPERTFETQRPEDRRVGFGAGAAPELTLHDSNAQGEMERAFEAHLLEDRRRGFDLAKPPLLRVALFHLGAERCRMLWTFHHILIDGRSFVTILQEVDGLYEQVRRGEMAGGEPADVSEYKRFVEWVHALEHAPAREFWRRQLAGFTAPTPLPLDLEASAEKDSARYGECERRLSEAASDRLRALAQQTGVTLNTVFMGAWAALLARYSGEADIVFGATKTGRRGSTAIGLFLNTIPVRISAARGRTVAEFLQDLRREWVELRQFEYTPLVEIKEASELPASSLLFDSLVVFENERFDSVLASSGGKWPARKCRLLEQTNYTLSFLAYGNREILFKLEYDARRYTRPMIERLLGHIERLLEAMAANPEASLGSLEMLGGDERRTIVEEWNRTEAQYPRDVLVPAAIAAQAAATPDRVAVTFRGATVTYAELNRRANQVARYLQRQGMGPGALVGVRLERSIEMLAALIGVMKCGAGYVPLDPGFPPERLSFMAEDARVGALLRRDTDWEAIAKEPGEDFPCPAQPDDLAYVLYTSGSTGKPKGVQITHRALANFEYSMAREPGMRAGDVLLAVTTISFDIAGLELYLPLMTGASLVLAPKDAVMDARALAAMIREHNVTVMQATPATWQMLLDSGWEGKRDLRVLCGGEALSRDLAARLVRASGELWNMYGPTETTIWSLVRRITAEDRAILIGRPIANTTVYVLDGAGNPVPPGVTGELYIGGEGVSAGYLNRMELTRERFVPDPFRAGAGNIYKTGDLARFWPNGELECLGRNDFQVKIRGFRIELGEIESALNDHPAVRQSVVAAREDQGGKRLVGYIVPAGELRPAVADLKNFLAARLPDYMVPGVYMYLEAFPLTPNGKVNRLALPAPEIAASAHDDGGAPRDEFEQHLCEAFAEVLRLERVGIHDNFFDLGGHSLLAVQLALRVQKIIPGEPMPLSVLLEAPTVERLAAWLRGRRSEGSPYLVRLRPGSDARPPFFCVHGAGGNVLSMRPLAMAMPEDLPFYCLQAKGLDGSKPFYTVEETARCYVGEIRKVQPHGPYYVGGGCYGGVVAFEMARQLEEQGEEVAALMMMDSYNFAFGKFLPRHELVWRNARFYFRRGAAHAKKLAGLPAREWARYVSGRLRTLRSHVAELSKMVRGAGGNQFPVDPNAVVIEGAAGTELGEVLKRVRQAGLISASTFVPKPYGGRAVIFRAGTRSVIEQYEDEHLGWGPVVRGGIEAIEIEGDHETIFEEPQVRAMAGRVNARLLEAQPAATVHAAG